MSKEPDSKLHCTKKWQVTTNDIKLEEARSKLIIAYIKYKPYNIDMCIFF